MGVRRSSALLPVLVRSDPNGAPRSPAPREASPGLDGAARRARRASLDCRDSVATGGSRGKRLPRGGEPGRPRPAFADHDRDSPDAASGLLRLIREATEGEVARPAPEPADGAACKARGEDDTRHDPQSPPDAAHWPGTTLDHPRDIVHILQLQFRLAQAERIPAPFDRGGTATPVGQSIGNSRGSDPPPATGRKPGRMRPRQAPSRASRPSQGT